MQAADPSERAACLVAIEGVYRGRPGGATLVKRDDWIAIPYEEGGDFSSGYAKRIAHTASLTNDPLLWVATDEPTPRVFVAPADALVLERTRDELSIHSVAVVAPSQRWLVVASEAEFGVLLCEPDLVTELAGFDPADAHNRFSHYLAKWQNPSKVVVGVANAPWSTYETLAPGADLPIRYW